MASFAAPEYKSIETFAQFMLDEERSEYTHEEMAALNFRTRMRIDVIRAELSSYGMMLAIRPNEKKVRGFHSNSHDRWTGPGSAATHGGSGFTDFEG